MGRSPSRYEAPRVSVYQSLGRVQLSATAWTVARPAPLPRAFPRQEYCSGFHFLLGGPSQPGELASPALAFFTTEPQGSLRTRSKSQSFADMATS